VNVSRSWAGRILAAVVALAVLVAGAVFVLSPGEAAMRLTAHFSSAVGIYVGSDVRILGVKVGEITRVKPEGRSVRIELTYERKYRVPADAVAVIVPPSVVSDRYVQLAPVYTSGRALPDGADLPVDRTATPVELDDIYRSLNDLNTALGPQGANSSGALSRLLSVGRKNLEGNGEQLNSTIRDLAKVTRTVADGRDDLFGTVRNLQQFTTALASSDAQVREFNANLATVSRQLDGEKSELAAAIRTLSYALAQLAAFVRENRQALASNVAALTQISAILVRQKRALTQVLDLAPEALSNLNLSYNADSGTLDTRDNALAGQDPAVFVCSALAGLPTQQIPAECLTLTQSLARGGAALPAALASLLKLTPPGAVVRGAPAPRRPVARGAAPGSSGDFSGPLDRTLGGILKGVS
jgi:phospholipid/cholesterol/gamma-HCH transport system substrate-binding protein